jgi:outer membrane lipoprotein SlyB
VIGGIVAGGLGGAFASGRHFGRGTEMLGAIGGAIAGGVGSHYALKSGMGHLIEGRNTEIHDKYEGNIENAYATLNRRLQKQD